MKQWQPAVELCRTDVAGIADLPPLPDISYDEFDADAESDDLFDFVGAKGKAPISSKQTEFFKKEFAILIGQRNISKFNMWKNVLVAGFHKKKHRSSSLEQNHLEQPQNGLLHGETTVADFLETFESVVPLGNFQNAEWIWRQWVQICVNQCASELQEVGKKGRRGNN
jgi:hypothetical protein